MDGEGAVRALRRWEASGAGWRVERRTASGVEVALLTCDGGEVVDRLVSGDPALIAFVDSRRDGDQPAGGPGPQAAPPG